jgi:deazaflavin-dependent oxidoreductase (nitroreductase family)
MAEHYQRPGWFTTNVLNRLVAGLTRLGVSVYGSRVLQVKGRRSGQWRETPVNLLRVDDVEYLVSPRGQTQWVKNLRASGEGRLRVGRRVQEVAAVELGDEEKVPLLGDILSGVGSVGHPARSGGTRTLEIGRRGR